jgi:hypothetical protein
VKPAGKVPSGYRRVTRRGTGCVALCRVASGTFAPEIPEQRAVAQGDDVPLEPVTRYEHRFRAGDEARGQAIRVEVHPAFTGELYTVPNEKRSGERVPSGTQADSSRALPGLECFHQLRRRADRDLERRLGERLVRNKQRAGGSG